MAPGSIACKLYTRQERNNPINRFDSMIVQVCLWLSSGQWAPDSFQMLSLHSFCIVNTQAPLGRGIAGVLSLLTIYFVTPVYMPSTARTLTQIPQQENAKTFTSNFGMEIKNPAAGTVLKSEHSS